MMEFCILISLLYHSYLVCILFGMPSLHLLHFLGFCIIFFVSCFCTFMMLILVIVPKPKYSSDAEAKRSTVFRIPEDV